MTCRHHFFADTSNFYRRLPDKDQSIRCMICCEANARSASWTMVMAEEEDNLVPVVLCATLLPSLLVLILVSHCDLFMQKMFRVIVSMVCCHEGRVSKMEEVCAFRQILPFCTIYYHLYLPPINHDLDYHSTHSHWVPLKRMGNMTS